MTERRLQTIATLVAGAFLLALWFVPARSAPLTITTDLGGTLGERMRIIARLREDRTLVRVIGTCASACLWVLTLPRDQVCFAPGAWLGQHTHLGAADDAIMWWRGRKMIEQGWRECG